jgi:hypothetical protein
LVHSRQWFCQLTTRVTHSPRVLGYALSFLAKRPRLARFVLKQIS